MSSYNKILVSKHDPYLKCDAMDDAVLIVIPRKKLMIKDHVNHHFVDAINRKTRSQFGWVKIVDEFLMDEFAKKYNVDLNDKDEFSHNLIMLDSIAKLSEGMSVAATYSKKDFEQKEMGLTVHRVFL
jgi:hypothetical protein